jgi:membrane protein implicated in regulation of membrane protease activity
MRFYLLLLFTFSLGAAAAVGVVSAVQAATGDLDLALILALASSVLLATVAITADRQARLRERRLRPEHGRSGGYHVPDFTVYSLDDLQLVWPLPDEQQ